VQCIAESVTIGFHLYAVAPFTARVLIEAMLSYMPYQSLASDAPVAVLCGGLLAVLIIGVRID
jgi:hypothetical protein